MIENFISSLNKTNIVLEQELIGFGSSIGNNKINDEYTKSNVVSLDCNCIDDCVCSDDDCTTDCIVQCDCY